MSHPWIFISPFDQWRLFSGPQAGRIPSFARVICFHSPIGPAQISDGFVDEFRITAEDWRSAVRETVGPPSASVEMTSGPVHATVTFPLGRSTLEIPSRPSTFSVNRILFGDSQ